MSTMGAARGKIDLIYSNKPRLFNVRGNSAGGNPASGSQYATSMMYQYPNQYPQQYQSQMQYAAQQQQLYPPQQQQNYSSWGGGQMQDMSMNQFAGMPPQQHHMPQQPIELQQQFNSGMGNPHEQMESFAQQKQPSERNKFDMRRMPPPPPPPPEMIQALMALTQNMQMNQGNPLATAAPGIGGTQQQGYAPSQYISSNGYDAMNSNVMGQQSNARRPQGQRLKLTSHVYKNQNAQTAPLNPKFFKVGDKTHQKAAAAEKEKLYKPNTGYTIEEEMERKDTVVQADPINIVIRGQDDLINSGVTTEMDDDDDEDGQLGRLKAADRNYIQQKFLASESISESQFKEHLPKLYVDPKHACTIEEQKILEKESEEEEFQKKKEVFLVKSKYKILAEMEKEKSRKLMEKLLKQELDTIEAKNREQEMTLKLEGEQMVKQKEQARDLERIIKDIREERDYKMINKVLGINIDKPLDEIIDLEKLKAEYAVEAMYKRNEELYEETNRLLRECDFYVDDNGRSYSTYSTKPAGENVSRSKARGLLGSSQMRGVAEDSLDGESDMSSSYGSSRELKSSSAALGASSARFGQGGASKHTNNPQYSRQQQQQWQQQHQQQNSRVRFNKSDMKPVLEEDDEETKERRRKQNQFYENIQKEVNSAQMKLDEMCQSMHESEVDDDFEVSGNQLTRGGGGAAAASKRYESSQQKQSSQQRNNQKSGKASEQSASRTLKKQPLQQPQQSQQRSQNSQPNSRNSTIKRK